MLSGNVFFRSSIWGSAFLTILSLDIAGCTTRGTIVVSQPEVFTRQRLVDRRLTEQQWLEDQLAQNTPKTQTLQGYQDVREFSGLYSKTSASFDPLAGKLTGAQTDLNFKNVQNQSEINALQHQIDLLKLQQQITALQNPSSNTGSSTGGGSSATGSGTSSTSGASNASPSSSATSSSSLSSAPGPASSG